MCYIFKWKTNANRVKKRKDKKNTPQKNYKNNSSDAVIEML